jgi:hypothetical protein
MHYSFPEEKSFYFSKKNRMTKFLLLAAIVLSNLIFSQVTFEKNHLMKDGKSYKLSQYDEVFQNPEAKGFMKKARTNKTVSEIFAYSGGFGLGFGIARLLSGGDKVTYQNGQKVITKTKSEGWGIVAAGVGLIGIGIPFAIGAKKNSEKALQIENTGTTAFQPYFKVEAGNGFALSYNF